MTSIFFQGLLLGLSIAAPVGPIAILCIRRTLALGRGVGLASGLGSATADGLYGCVAGFGLTAIADFLTQHALWFRVGGALFLGYLGVTTFLAKPTEVALLSPLPDRPMGTHGSPIGMNASLSYQSETGKAKPSVRSLLAAYGSTLVLTLTNPATIVFYIAVFAGLGLVEVGRDYATASTLVLGVFLGSAAWWCMLSGLVGGFRDRFTPNRLRWLNRLSGVVLLAFACLALAGG